MNLLWIIIFTCSGIRFDLSAFTNPGDADVLRVTGETTPLKF